MVVIWVITIFILILVSQYTGTTNIENITQNDSRSVVQKILPMKHHIYKLWTIYQDIFVLSINSSTSHLIQ